MFSSLHKSRFWCLDILKQKLLGDKYKLRVPSLKSGMIPTIFLLNNDKNSNGNTIKKSRSERIKNQEKKYDWEFNR